MSRLSDISVMDVHPIRLLMGGRRWHLSISEVLPSESSNRSRVRGLLFGAPNADEAER